MPSDEIKILGENAGLSKPQDGSKKVCDLYLDLSDIPSRDWERIFEIEWNQEKAALPSKDTPGTQLVSVYLSGSNLKITCLWDDEHLSDYRKAIERAVESTNKALRERNQMFGRDEQADKQATQNALRRLMS